MMKYIAILVLVFASVSVHSTTECEDPVEQGSARNPISAIVGAIGVILGRPSSAGEPNCQPHHKDDIEIYPPLQSDPVVGEDVAIKAPIAENKMLLEQLFEGLKDEIHNDIVGLRQDITLLEQKVLDLKETVKYMKINNTNTTKAFSDLKNDLSRTKTSVGANREDIADNRNNIAEHVNNLNERLDNASSELETTENKLAEQSKNNRQEANKSVQFVINKVSRLNSLVSDNNHYFMAAISAVFFLFTLIFYFLRKKVLRQDLDLTSGLLDARKSLEIEFVKIDNKLVEIFEAQIKSLESASGAASAEVDHSLVIKIADEIVRMQKNISRMDGKTKGLKQLVASVSRIQDNVSSNGYEIVEMLGNPYSEGMKVSATFVPNEDLEEGVRVISRVIKPQINYHGVMIQSAQIEVSQGG